MGSYDTYFMLVKFSSPCRSAVQLTVGRYLVGEHGGGTPPFPRQRLCHPTHRDVGATGFAAGHEHVAFGAFMRLEDKHIGQGDLAVRAGDNVLIQYVSKTESTGMVLECHKFDGVRPLFTV